MPRTRSHLVALAIAAGTVAALGGCGEEDAELLPGSTASEINANLDTVNRLSDEGDCEGAQSAAQQVSEQVEVLGGIDPKLKEALRDGARRLNEVVERCEEEEEAVDPAEIPPSEEDEVERDDDEDSDRDKAKEEEKEQKEAEKDEEKEGRGPPSSTPSPGSEKGPPEATPPQQAPPAEPPSGGVEPASPVEEGEEG
jgi:septal ring-binding cell division protein DamX